MISKLTSKSRKNDLKIQHKFPFNFVNSIHENCNFLRKIGNVEKLLSATKRKTFSQPFVSSSVFKGWKSEGATEASDTLFEKSNFCPKIQF